MDDETARERACVGLAYAAARTWSRGSPGECATWARANWKRFEWLLTSEEGAFYLTLAKMDALPHQLARADPARPDQRETL